MCLFVLCFFKDTATTVIYTYCHTLSLHDALPICAIGAVLWFVVASDRRSMRAAPLSALRHLRSATPIIRCSAAFSAFASIRHRQRRASLNRRSEEHTSELQSLMRISYAVFCLKKKKYKYRTKYSVPLV